MDDVEAVCFDLDGTLCRSTQDDEDIHRDVFARAGVEPFFEPPDLYAVDPTTLPDPETDREHFEQVYRAAAEHAGTDPSASAIRAAAEATLVVLDPTAVAFRDGADEALAHAREHYRVGLLTNGKEETQSAKLDVLGIADAFDAVVYCGPGTDLPSKPDPGPFRVLLDALDVEPEASVYVGDRLDGDVPGAHNAGMQSAWMASGEAPMDVEPEPTYRLETIGELADVLAESG